MEFEFSVKKSFHLVELLSRTIHTQKPRTALPSSDTLTVKSDHQMSILSRRHFLSVTATATLAAVAPRFGFSQEQPKKLIDCHLHINHYDRSIEDTIRHMD